MANFFNDLFDSITNQQATPQRTITNTNDLLNQSYATAIGQIPNFTAYNNALQPVLTGMQLNNQNQIFGPAANQVQQGAYKSVLDNLNLGNQVPQDLQDLITTNTLQGLGASGIGTSDAGKLFGARSLLSAGLDLGRQRQQDALAASNLLPTSHYSPTPAGGAGIDVGGISQDIRGVQSAQDELANITENIRRENFSALINTGGRILGTAVGAYFGGAAGAQMGGQIGGSLGGHTSVAGYSTQNQGGGGGGMFDSLLKGFGGGGSYGKGSGGFYGMGANQYDQGADLGVSTNYGGSYG